MNIKNHLVCPKCQGIHFELKQKATYLYSYQLNTPLTNDGDFQGESLPFLFDNRDKLSSDEYIQCKTCGEQYCYDLNNNMVQGELTILKKAVRSSYTNTPEFLG